MRSMRATCTRTVQSSIVHALRRCSGRHLADPKRSVEAHVMAARAAALANVQSYLPVHACTIRPGARSDDSSGETEAEKGETGNGEEKDETIMLAIMPPETH